MKICRFNGGRTALVTADGALDITDRLASQGMEPVLAAARLDQQEVLAMGGARLPLASLRLESPVSRPGKIIAAPVNYRAHIAEMFANGQSHGHNLTDIRQAGLFLKATSSVVGAAHGVRQRFLDRRTDHEVELCVVIGREADRVAPQDALSYVAGYCLGLDITVRGPEDRSFRKSIDTYCVLGPWLVTSDEIPDPGKLEIRLRLNGELRQDASTSDMVMGVAELLSFASSYYTLQPGDVLMTGTPSGVGPIRPGDVMVAEGSGLGSMRVEVSAAEGG